MTALKHVYFIKFIRKRSKLLNVKSQKSPNSLLEFKIQIPGNVLNSPQESDRGDLEEDKERERSHGSPLKDRCQQGQENSSGK